MDEQQAEGARAAKEKLNRAVGRWVEVEGMPRITSIKPPYRPLEFLEKGRREVSSLSDAPGHGATYIKPAYPRIKPAHESKAHQKHDFRGAFASHNAAFEEVTKQVGVHCAERGELLARLQAFYTRSIEVTARLAERSLKEKLEGKIATAEAENARLRAELAATRAKLDASAVGKKEPQALIASVFGTLSEAQRQAVLHGLVSHSGELLLATAAGGAVPLGEQVALLRRALRGLPPAERARLVAALAAGQEAQHAVATLRQMLAATPPEQLAPLVLSVLDEKQRQALLVGGFAATPERARGAALAELLGDGAEEGVGALAEALLHAFSDSRRVLGALLRRLAGLDADKLARDVCAAGLRALAAAGHAPLAAGAVQQYADGLDGAAAPELAAALLRGLPLERMLAAQAALARRCDAAERRALLHALLGALPAAELEGGVAPALPRLGAAALVGAMSSAASLFEQPEALTKLCLGVHELGAREAAGHEAAGLGVAALYRALPPPEARLACLRELTATDAFEDDEIALLMLHVRQVRPSSLKKFVNAWANPSAAGLSRQRAPRLEPLGGKAKGAGKGKKGKGADEGPQMLPMDNSLRLVADIYSKKVREDALSDAKGKPRMPLTKFVQNYMLRQYGMKGVADKALRDLQFSVQQYVDGKADVGGGGGADGGKRGKGLMPRIRLFGEMMGMVEGVDAWEDGKVNFFFALLSTCVLADKATASGLSSQSSRRLSTVGKRASDVGSVESVVRAQVSDTQSASILKETFVKEELLVSVTAVSKTLEVLVRDARLRKGLLDDIRRSAVEVLSKDKGQPTAMVNIDDMLHYILDAWQGSEERRMERYGEALGALFDAVDGNGNGLLDYGEFRRLLESDEMSEEKMLDVFDNAIQLTSELSGDWMDSVSRDAFVQVAADVGLRVPSESAFADPVKMAAERLSEGKDKAGGRNPKVRRTIINPYDAKKEEAGAEKAQKVQKSSYITTLIKAAVQSNFLFRHLDDAMLEEVVGYMSPAPVKAGDTVIKQGDKGDYFYVCERGAYDVLVDGRKVHTYTINTAQNKYPCFGELALMYAKPRAATVVANEDGMLWRLGRAGFRTVQSTIGGTDVTKVLRNVAVFSSLRFEQLQQLRDHMKVATFEDGEYVFRQGDDADAFYVISRGNAAAVKRDTPDAPEHELMRLEESMYFGERALINNDSRAASVRAVGRLQTAFITRGEFESLLGPLQALLDADRRQREKAEADRQRELEQFGLAHASLGSFTLDACVAALPCGAVYLATQNTTAKQYTLRAEAKAQLAAASEQPRVAREVAQLRELSLREQQCYTLPALLHTFASDAALFSLFARHCVCELPALVEFRRDGEREGGRTLGEAPLVFVAACAVQALDHLHDELQLLHRNLVPESLYVQEDGYVVLQDLRFAKRDDGNCRTLCGSPAYFAPEVVRGEAQSPATDWWAFGILLHELVSGDSPWGAADADDMTLLKRITAHAPGALNLGEAVSPTLIELLDELLQPDKARRRGGSTKADGASGEQGHKLVRAHPWFAEINWERLLEGAMPSPLRQAAQELLQQKIAEGPGEELTTTPYVSTVGSDTAWMDAF